MSVKLNSEERHLELSIINFKVTQIKISNLPTIYLVNFQWQLVLNLLACNSTKNRSELSICFYLLFYYLKKIKLPNEPSSAATILTVPESEGYVCTNHR